MSGSEEKQSVGLQEPRTEHRWWRPNSAGEIYVYAVTLNHSFMNQLFIKIFAKENTFIKRNEHYVYTVHV